VSLDAISMDGVPMDGGLDSSWRPALFSVWSIVAAAHLGQLQGNKSCEFAAAALVK